MSNLRSDCRDLVANLPVGHVMRSHMERLAHQLDHVEELWHAAERRAKAAWYEDIRLPTEPGLYYMESCDQYGNLMPGLMLLEEGKPCEKPSAPTLYFGPIPGAMRKREMVPTEKDAPR